MKIYVVMKNIGDNKNKLVIAACSFNSRDKAEQFINKRKNKDNYSIRENEVQNMNWIFKTKSFKLNNEKDVVDFLRWHNNSYDVRYKWSEWKTEDFEINIPQVYIKNKMAIMRIPYVKTKIVSCKELIGTKIEAKYVNVE